MDRIARSLEDQFFFKEDLKLMEKQRMLKHMKETKEAIQEASGIQDEAVLQKLVELKISPETVATLVVIPLIEVAWANGSIGSKEKEAVLKAVNTFGWTCGSVDYVLVERWLEHKPDPALLCAWVHYTEHISTCMLPNEVAKFKAEVLAHARAVAEASGGILGIGKMSSKERDILEIIEHAFVTEKKDIV